MEYDFTAAQFAESGQRALCSVIHKYKYYPDMCYKTFETLYTNYVAPVLDYGSGIWEFKSFSKVDSVQYGAQRVFLGVRRFAPSLGLEGEFGWLNSKSRRWLNMIRFWNRLIDMRSNRLTKHVFLSELQKEDTIGVQMYYKYLRYGY